MAQVEIYWSRTEDYRQNIEVDDAKVLAFLNVDEGYVITASDVKDYLEAGTGAGDPSEDDPSILLNAGDGEWLDADDPVIRDVSIL